MARPLRIEFAGAVYHVTSRGNGRQRIFLDDHDNRKFLELLGKTIERFHWICHAFCLMVNHYHLMIETPEANLSKGMHHLNANFCQAHNKRHATVGHLFQGRFKAIVVDRESYLLELARYVVLNPVRAGIVARPEDWPWSSYCATAGLPVSPASTGAAEASVCLTTTWLLSQFCPNEAAARQRYRDFVSSGIGINSPWSKLQSQLFLGKETFIDQVKGAIPDKTTVQEIPKLQRFANRPSLKEIFGEWKTRWKRDEAIVASYFTYGYEQREIANFLGIHYTTVCRTIRRYDEKR
ncbi:MAG: transposase [Deltaproteobacteria bacterium]|nr:transposase [Deltaproteobacteria bacterium]